MEQKHSEITEFLSDNLFKTQILPRNKLHFSHRSKDFIGKLFNDINQSERIYISDNITGTTLNINKDGLPSGQSYSYCPQEIRDEIESKSKCGFQYMFNIKDRKFNIVLVSPDKLNIVIPYMKKAIKNIYMWLYVASQYAKPKCSEQMNVYIYLTGLSKMLPEKEATISRMHVNTAFTTACQTQTEVHVFRREEWFKTFIHETFHNMGMDFSAYDNNLINNEMYTIFPVNTDFRLYESYCEMWGETMAILFNVHRSMRRNTKVEYIQDRIPNMIKSVEAAIIQETYHALFQVSKILSHYGLTYDELIKNNMGQNGCSYKEDTPVLSYFVIKSILMYNIDEFLQWCIHNNGSSLNFTNLLSNDEIQAKMKRYCGIAKKHYKDEDYIDILSEIQHIYKGIKPIRKNRYILQNLRMTITEP